MIQRFVPLYLPVLKVAFDIVGADNASPIHQNVQEHQRSPLCQLRTASLPTYTFNYEDIGTKKRGGGISLLLSFTLELIFPVFHLVILFVQFFNTILNLV